MKTKAKKPARQVAQQDSVTGFTKRLLLSLIVDRAELNATAERISIQIATLAEAHDIRVPASETV